MGDAPDSIRPTIDIALLADAVQAVRGKLFVLGGGWDTLWVRALPARHPSMAIGLRLRVPFSWRGETLRLSVELQDADGAPVLPHPLAQSLRLAAQQVPAGVSDFSVLRSFTFNNLLFAKEGSYSFVIAVDDEPLSRLRFAVRLRPGEPASGP